MSEEKKTEEQKAAETALRNGMAETGENISPDQTESRQNMPSSHAEPEASGASPAADDAVLKHGVAAGEVPADVMPASEQPVSASPVTEEADVTRDPDDASNALARVQQIFEELEDLPEIKAKKKSLDSEHEHSDAAPVTEGAEKELREICDRLHPSDIAWVLEALPLDERLALWNFVKSDRDGEILIEVNDGVRETLIEAMNREELVDAVETLDTDEIADLVPDLPPDVAAEVQDTMTLEERSQLRAAMSYPEDSVGSRMDFEMISVHEEVTVARVFAYLRKFQSLPDHADKLFVVDRHGHFLGTLTLARLLVSDPVKYVRDLMQKDVLTLSPLDKVGDAAQAFERYDLVSAAVVDEAGRLVGRLTVDEVVDVIREESEEGVYGAVGLDEDQDIFSSVWETAKSRWLWLGVNLCTAFVASRVVAAFDDTISHVVALAALMPIVAGMAGNSGNQTLTLLVRSMAMGQVTDANVPDVIRREVTVAVINGMIWGVIAGLLAWFLYSDTAQGVTLALVMFLAMLLNIMLGALVGVSVPTILKACGKDPAMGGSVLLTFITDSGGFLIFLSLATIFFRGMWN